MNERFRYILVFISISFCLIDTVSASCGEYPCEAALGKFIAHNSKDYLSGQTCNCPIGTVNPVNAQKLGQSAQQQSVLVCESCVGGTYAPNYGMSACLFCAPGFFSPAAAYPFAPGTLSPQQGGSDCGGGTDYTAAVGYSTCYACNAGTYSYGNSSICFPCPANTTSPAESTSVEDCVGPNVGTCPAGEAEVAPSDCVPCGPGTYVPDGGTQCLDCSAGYFSNQTANPFCVPCLPGTASNSTASESCPGCAPGSYSQIYGEQTCQICPGGFYSNETGSVICTGCDTGLYSATGSSVCSSCGINMTSIDHVVCLCIPGHYYNNITDECALCPEGTYIEAPSLNRTCNICPYPCLESVPSRTYCQVIGTTPVLRQEDWWIPFMFSIWLLCLLIAIRWYWTKPDGKYKNS